MKWANVFIVHTSSFLKVSVRFELRPKIFKTTKMKDCLSRSNNSHKWRLKINQAGSNMKEEVSEQTRQKF